jgi:hypothetical protein
MTDSDLLDQLPSSIRTFVEATNAGDSDAFLGAFTPDGVLDDWGRTFHGHDGIRQWDSTDNIGVQSHFNVQHVAAGDTADSHVVTLEVSGNGYNGTGPMVFQLRDGLIASVKIG